MKRLFITMILGCMVAASCGRRDAAVQDEAAGDRVSEIQVTAGRHAAVSGVADNGDVSEVLTVNEFAEESLLYISQMGTTLPPSFDTGSNNCYVYEYEYNEDASWDAEGTYNFHPQDKLRSISWSTVRRNGSVGNAFSFYAFYFPVDDEVRFNVEKDQRELDNLLKSDIMGAYHATSALFTRMRFRLYHLMVYLRVTLYVPVYEEGETIEEGYSGFKADAFRTAVMQKMATDFEIEWRANRSSDTDAPLVVWHESDQKETLRLHFHGAEDYFGKELSAIEANHPVQELNIGEYYGDDSEATDRVRAYEFSVLFPAQKVGEEFLRFQLQSPGRQGDGNVLNYYFSASQLKVGATDFTFTQGTLQHLSLYLPRNGNQTILVGAKILPWTEADTEMTVTQDKTQENE